MKFFWKIFFTAMFISVICVTISGYIIININFQSQLDNEIKTAQDYSEIAYYALSNKFEDLIKDGTISFIASSAENTSQDMVSHVVQSVSISSMNQKIEFGVVDTNQNTVFTSLNVVLDKSIISSLGDTDMAWTLKENGNSIYIQTVRPIFFIDSLFYIETIRDVTGIFTNQRAQYETMIKVILFTIVFAGLLTFIISKLLLRRIVELTKITKRISNGNLSKRVKVKGQDEIALLSENFNHMADSLEEKIQQLKEEAEKKEMFVGAFSHELKTPLTSIVGYSDLLRRKKIDEEQMYICAEYIFTEGKRLETLSMRLLDLIVLKKQSLSPKPALIKNVLDEVKTVVFPKLHSSNIKLIYDIEQAVIPMEAELMKTVFINVIDNAQNAIETNGTIKVRGRRQKDGYVVTIRDSGKGMETKELKRITDAFYMVDKSRSRKHGGAGLGLAICNEILMLHGFEIRFDSTVNIGTVVTITMGGQGK